MLLRIDGVMAVEEVMEWRERLMRNILSAALVESARPPTCRSARSIRWGTRGWANWWSVYRDGAVPARLDAGLELTRPDAAALAELGLLPSEVRRVQQLVSSSAGAREQAAPEIRALLAAIVALGFA